MPQKYEKKQIYLSIIAILIILVPIFVIGNYFAQTENLFKYDLGDTPEDTACTIDYLVVDNSSLENSDNYITGIWNTSYPNIQFIINVTEMFYLKIPQKMSIWIETPNICQFSIYGVRVNSLGTTERITMKTYYSVPAGSNFYNYTFDNVDKVWISQYPESKIIITMPTASPIEMEDGDNINLDFSITYSENLDDNLGFNVLLIGIGVIFIVTGIFMLPFVDVATFKKLIKQ